MCDYKLGKFLRHRVSDRKLPRARHRHRYGVARGVGLCALLLLAKPGAAFAQDAQPGTASSQTSPTAVLPASPNQGGFFSTFTYGVQVDAGIYGNPARPPDGENFGQLFTDKSNEPLLNQVLVTLSRPIDPAAKGYDFGFTIQGIYGTDARYLHILGIDDHLLNGRNQIIPDQAFLAVHVPWFTTLGMDLKGGIVQGLEGFETLDPSTRPFYSLSYISDFLLPFLHVGIQGTLHVNPTIDLIFGIDTGNQTAFGQNDNNNVPAGYLGFALNNLADGKLGITAVTRLGSETPLAVRPDADQVLRSWSDVVATYKYNDKISYTIEANYFHDDGFPNSGNAYGVAGYVTYIFNDHMSVSGRAEVLRDNTGLVVGQFIGATSYTDSLRGATVPTQFAPPSTYGEVTLGVTYKPTVDWKAVGLPVKTFAFRPEVRYDRSLSGTNAFDVLRQKDAFMVGGDVILGF